MLKLSVVIITKNEELNIERCVDSVKAIADEIVVVDSFSTDGTVEICNRLGVTIIQHAFAGYIEQKNYALIHTTHPIVLSLDADEALSPLLTNSILNAKNDWTADGYTMNRLTNYCGKWIYHCGWYPDKKLRLFDKTKGKWAGANPHDILIMNEGATNMHLKGDILHYSYNSVSEHILQANNFTTIAAQSAFQNDKKSNVLKIIFSPVVKFIKSYFFQLGILDGFYGFLICKISAQATFYKYVKLWMLQHKK